jgi:hypothetical protein
LKYTGDDPGMAVGLYVLPDCVPTPDGLTIVEVLDLATLEKWVSTRGGSYEADEANRRGRLSFGGHLPCISKLC